jgi:hypothetical protein
MPIQSQKKNQITDESPLVVKPPEYIPEPAKPLLQEVDVAVKNVSDFDDSSIEITSENELVNNNDTNDTDINAIKTKWPAFLDVLLKERSNLGSFLSSGYIDSVAAGVINLKF